MPLVQRRGDPTVALLRRHRTESLASLGETTALRRNAVGARCRSGPKIGNCAGLSAYLLPSTLSSLCSGKLDEQSDAFWQSAINYNLTVTMAQHGHSEVSI